MLIRKKGFLLPLAIFFIAFVIRQYRISDYLFFGFEQGRDAQIIEKIYKLQDFVIVGPSTSIGGLFHGPWYYYLLAFPYGISSGNPLAASIYLITLGSLVPVVMFFLGKEIFKSKTWGIVTALAAIFSYEYILYSRWLSNVSPAPLFIALAFLMLWKFLKHEKDEAPRPASRDVVSSRTSLREENRSIHPRLKNSPWSSASYDKYFLGFILSAAIATSFQMILSVQFIFVLLTLFAFRLLKILNKKTVLFALLIVFIIFLPQILFDFRNQHITFNSLLNFGGDSLKRDSGGLFSGLSVYFTQMRNHISLSTINVNYLWSQLLLMSFIILGTLLNIRSKPEKVATIFLYVWGLMSLPLIWVSPGNPQYYVGVGLGWIMLFCLALKKFWENRRLKIFSIVGGLVFLVGISLTVYNLNFNHDVFFRTFQDDLNYKDQKAVLDFVHKDSANQPYRLVAFTIPSLHPEAWDYLHLYFYPENRSENAKIIYVLVEKYVYPVWEEKWINDLGKTELISENKFGLLRLQKRKVID